MTGFNEALIFQGGQCITYSSTPKFDEPAKALKMAE